MKTRGRSRRGGSEALTSMNNLAIALSDQGKYEQAEEIHHQTLGLMEMVLGKEGLNNLALVLT
jgi:Tetratricopeptide repeat